MSFSRALIRMILTPNAQVQGRALGVAEACSGEGVPCNARLGAGLGTQRLDMMLIASDPLVA